MNPAEFSAAVTHPRCFRKFKAPEQPAEPETAAQNGAPREFSYMGAAPDWYNPPDSNGASNA